MPPEDSANNNDAVAQATAGLVNKNNELLGELKAAKAKLKEFESLDLDALQTAAKTLKSQESEALEKKGEYEKLMNQMREDHAKEIAKRDEALRHQKETTRGILIQTSLQSALANVHIDPEMMEAATDMLSAKVAVTEKDGALVSGIGDKSVKDWVSEWAKTNVGKRFILADTGAGGGAVHSTNGNASSTVSKGDWEKKFDPNSPEYSMMDQARLLDENAELYAALVKKYEQAVKNKMMGGSYFHG